MLSPRRSDKFQVQADSVFGFRPGSGEEPVSYGVYADVQRPPPHHVEGILSVDGGDALTISALLNLLVCGNVDR